MAVLVCGSCYSTRKELRLSKLFLARRVMARNRESPVGCSERKRTIGVDGTQGWKEDR